MEVIAQRTKVTRINDRLLLVVHNAVQVASTRVVIKHIVDASLRLNKNLHCAFHSGYTFYGTTTKISLLFFFPV